MMGHTKHSIEVDFFIKGSSNGGHLDFEQLKSILEHMFIYKVCSTHRDEENDGSHITFG